MAQNENKLACEGKLVSYLDWKETPETEWSLHLIDGNGGSLKYRGASHSDDATDAQFPAQRQAWALQKPKIAFFEGPDRGVADSVTEPISKFGKSDFVRYMAKTDGVKKNSLEPNPQEEVDYLLSQKEFTPEQIKLFFILREASRLRARKNITEEQIKATIAQLLQRANSVIPAFATVSPDVASLQPA